MIPELLILAQRISSLNGIGEQIINNLLIISNTLFRFILILFRRPTVWRNEGAVGPPFQAIFPKMTELFENGISGITKVILISTIGKMFP